MKTYLYLQFKRAARLFPFVLVVALVLFGALLAVFRSMLQETEETDTQNAMLVAMAITGDTDYPYFDLVLRAVQKMDVSQFAITIEKMEENEAKRALERGEISAYAVLPDGFIESALNGHIKTITYVTTTGAMDTMSLFKEEVTEVISGMLAESQKGVYGIGNALDDNGHEDISHDKLNDMNIEYLKMILDRDELYRVETIEAAEDLPLQTGMFSGLTVFFVFLTTLPYALLYVPKNNALQRVLLARGRPSFGMLLCEFAAFFAAIFSLFFITLAGLSLLADTAVEGIPSGGALLGFALQLIPVVLMVAAFAFLVFELCGNLVVGMLWQFLLSLALCYLGGCLYPLYAFPQAVQDTAIYLPSAMAQEYLSACLVGNVGSWAGVVLYAVAFVALAAVIRHVRVTGKRGCAA